MPVTNYCFIDEADRAMASGSGSEITYRSASSRAYYGLYHCALAYADTLLTPPLSACGGSSHKKVSDYYKVGLAPTREKTVKFRKVSYQLLQLHSQRVKADYRLDTEFHEADAVAVLISSKSTFQDLVDLGASSTVSTPPNPASAPAV